MSKKRFSPENELDEDEELLLDRKAKRKRERELERQRREEEARQPQKPADDTMTKVVAMCQENRWREAELLCLGAIDKAVEDGTPEAAMAPQLALQKIDRSLRRQMIAAFVKKADEMLNSQGQ